MPRMGAGMGYINPFEIGKVSKSWRGQPGFPTLSPHCSSWCRAPCLPASLPELGFCVCAAH